MSEINLRNAFVALYNEKIVGFSHYKHVKEKLAKTTIMTVLPEYRKLGIGKDLQIARMKDAYNRGYKQLITYCDTPKVADWYINNFNYKILRTEPNHHRLHFLKVKTEVIWAVHYGFHEFKNCKVLTCDLENFFH